MLKSKFTHKYTHFLRIRIDSEWNDFKKTFAVNEDELRAHAEHCNSRAQLSS